MSPVERETLIRGWPSVSKSQAPVFEVNELGSCSQSAPEAFQLCAGPARDVGAPVSPKGKAPGQGVEEGLPGAGGAEVRLRWGLQMKTERRRLSWQPLEEKPFIIFCAVGLVEDMTVVPALCTQMPRGKSHSLRGGILSTGLWCCCVPPQPSVNLGLPPGCYSPLFVCFQSV